MNDTGAKLGLVAVILLIVGSALLWNSIYRRTMREPRPPSDRLVVFEHGGLPRARSAARRAPPPRRITPAPGPRSRPTPAFAPRPRPTPAFAPHPRPTPAPSAVACSSGGGTYEVRSGDCLSLISERVYGKSARWPEIARANGIEDPYVVQEGQVLTIPQ